MSAADEAGAIAYRAELAAQQRAVNAREIQLRAPKGSYQAIFAQFRPLLPDVHFGPDIVYAWPDQVGADQAEGVTDERTR